MSALLDRMRNTRSAQPQIEEPEKKASALLSRMRSSSQLVAPVVPVEEAAPEQEEGFLTKAKNAVTDYFDPANAEELLRKSQGKGRAIRSGLSLGIADEVGSAIKAIPALFNDDETYREAYDRDQAKVGAEMKAYAEENPKSDLMWNLVGGLGTGSTEIKAMEGIANALRLGKVAPKLLKTKLATNIAKGATIGGVAGAGNADAGERLGRGAMGGALGGAMTGGIDVAGKVINSATTRRIANDLVNKAGEFIPLSMQDDVAPLVKSIYRTVGGAFLPRYRQQVEKVIKARTATAEGLEEAAGKLGAKQSAKIQSAKDTVGAKLDDDLAILADKRSSRVKRMSDLTAKGNTRLKKSTADKVKTESEALQKEIDTIDRSMQQTSIRAALPVDADPVMVEKILKMKPREALEAIEGQKHRMFNVAKGKSFEFDPQDVTSKIKKELEGTGFEDYIPEAQKIIDRATKGRINNNAMSGDDILGVRNKIGIVANMLKGDGEPQVRASALRQVKDIIDDMIMDGLQGADKTKFAQELAQYRGKIVLRNVGDQIIEKPNTYGGEQVLKGLKNTQKRQARSGQAMLQDEAEASIERKGLERATSQGRVDELEKNLAENVSGRVNRLKNAKAASSSNKRRLSEELDTRNSARDKNRRLDQSKIDNPLEKTSPEGVEAAKLRQYIADNDISIPNIFTQKASAQLFGQLARLGLTGAGIGIGGFSGALLPLGVAIQGLMGTQGAQKALAGQTGLQKAVSKAFTPENRDKAMQAIMTFIKTSETQK